MAARLTPPNEPFPAAAEYFFHLDALPAPVRFSARLELTGWLFHRQGAPIHGLRAVVKAPLRRERLFKARRKRARPAIGAAYPSLPDAAMSGFLIEIDRLPLGSASLELEVKDENRDWRTIFSTRISTLSLDWLDQMRLPHLRYALVSRLARGRAAGEGVRQIETGELAEIKARIANAATIAEPVTIRSVLLHVTSKSNLFIREIAQLVCAGFEEAGFAAQLLVDQVPEAETPADTIQIVVTPHEFYNLFLTEKLPKEEVRRRTGQLYLLGTEQPESDWFHSNLVIAPYARAMLDINQLGVEGYRTRGLRCLHLPLGYHPMLAATTAASPNQREIDICLLASKTERRERFLATHADFFAERNCHLRLVPITFAKTETTRSYLSTAKRNALLQNAKILLNIHYSELRYFEWHRMLVGIANGCCIVTETCEGYAPLVPGKHFVMVEPDMVIPACRYYLEHPAEREAIALAGQDFIRQHLTQAQNCATCAEQIANGRYFSSAHEKDPGAEALPLELSRSSLRADNGSGIASAVANDLRHLFTPRARAPLTIAPREIDEKAILAICEKRKGFAERFAAQEAAAGRGEPVWEISDNELVHAKPNPAISVIITLYNYERYIRPCVASVEAGAQSRIPGGIEILIVNDASSDRSLDHAREVQRTSTLPVRIVAKQFNTGLADARNVGLRLARAPYAFIMDADNLIFPRAFELLYAAITREHSAAAYSILCRFRDRPENRRGLLSYYDWDPRILVEHPYIDAMALFDREQLVALGGYDNDLYKIGWFGWEDYEFWLRMAAAHLAVTFVPNILCLYRHHESAMSNTTNLFEVDLVQHLMKKYQALIDEYRPKERVFGVDWERLG